MTNAAADDLAGDPAEEPSAGSAPAPSATDRGAQAAGAPGGAERADSPAQGPDPEREGDAAGRTGAAMPRRRAEESLRFLAHAGEVLAASLDYETTLANVARLAVPHLADRCVVSLREEDGGIRWLAGAHADSARAAPPATGPAPAMQSAGSSADPAREAPPRADADHPALEPHWALRVRKVLRTGRPEVGPALPDPHPAPSGGKSEATSRSRAAGAGPELIVPLVARERVLGALTLARPGAGRSYDAHDRALAEDFGRRAAQAIDNALLYHAARETEQRARRQAERLDALAAATQAFAEAHLDLPTLLETIARRAVELVGDVCVIRLLSPDGRWLEPVALHHADPEALAFAREMLAAAPERVDEGLNAQVMRSGQPLLLPTVRLDEVRVAVKPEYLPYLERFGARSVLIVPLRVRGQAIGVLSAARERPGRPYSAEDQAFFQDLADRAAGAIDNARLHRTVQEALAGRDEFLSVAAHELRTPLTNVRGYVELLTGRLDKAGGEDPLRIRPALGAIDRESEKLVRLVAQLLDVSRIEAGQLTLDRRPTDVARVVADVAASVQLRTGRHTIRVDAPAPVPALVDPLRLEQVLANLLGNATKYSPDGGLIEVGVSPADAGMIRLTVRDRGGGIPSEHLPRIFERFYRVRPHDAVAGMGLGLYISRQIVELHGGRIEVESPPDGGTRFTISMPTGLATPDAREGQRA